MFFAEIIKVYIAFGALSGALQTVTAVLERQTVFGVHSRGAFEIVLLGAALAIRHQLPQSDEYLQHCTLLLGSMKRQAQLKQKKGRVVPAGKVGGIEYESWQLLLLLAHSRRRRQLDNAKTTETEEAAVGEAFRCFSKAVAEDYRLHGGVGMRGGASVPRRGQGPRPKGSLAADDIATESAEGHDEEQRDLDMELEFEKHTLYQQQQGAGWASSNEWHADARVWRCVGEACIDHKDYLLAVEAYRRAIAALRAPAGLSNQPTTMHRKLEAQMLQRLSVALKRCGDHAAAEVAVERSFKVFPAIAKARAKSSAWPVSADSSGDDVTATGAGSALVCLAPQDLSLLLSPRSEKQQAAADAQHPLLGAPGCVSSTSPQPRMQLPPIQLALPAAEEQTEAAASGTPAATAGAEGRG